MSNADGNVATVAQAVNSEDYTIVQLRQWLRRLELPMSGNKASLLLRLNRLTAEERGECPEAEQLDADAEPESVNEIDVENEASEGDAEGSENYEMELLKSERELLQRENDMLKRELQQKTQEMPSLDMAAEKAAPLSLIKELVPEFDENSHFELWSKQVRTVADAYRLGDSVMRVVIISKLKGRALSWLHSNVNSASVSVNQLLSLMENVFGAKESKLILRQRFEARKWNASESFTEYYNDKNILANVLQLDEDELVDYIIDGIPNEQIQMQAYMQCFKTKTQLLQAFCKVQLKVATASPQSNGQVERVNRSIGPMLAKLVNNSTEWYKEVEKVEFVLNNTVHKATGEHPSVLLFGTSQRGKNVDLLRENLTQTLDKNKIMNFRKIRSRAQRKQRKLQIYNKKYFNGKRKKPTVYNTGDYVMIKNFDSHVGAPRKLIPKFKGPYKVFKRLRNDRYVLKDVDGFQQSQIPYVGTWAVNNIRPWIGNTK